MRTIGRLSLASLALAVTSVHPPAQAAPETVTLARTETVYASEDGVNHTLLAVCRATATETAALTMVRCTVSTTQWILRMPPQSPVSPGGLIWNLSETSLPGPFAVAVWEGGGALPLDVCAYAEATFNRPTGPPYVATDGPECVPVNG